MIDLKKENTFVVSLKSRPERLAAATKELKQHNIPFTLWEATKNENGRLGLIQTMRGLFEHCIKKGLENVTVFEDDIKLLNLPLLVLGKCFSQLPDDWHIFYLGPNLAKPPNRHSENLLKVRFAYSSHACIYSKRAIELILEQIDSATVYDIFLVEKIQSKGKSFCAFPMIAVQSSGWSDIEQRDVNYERFLQKRYYQQTKFL